MGRRKSSVDLLREWRALPRDWYSIYQWPSIGASAYSERIAAHILAGFAQISLTVIGLRQRDYAVAAHKGQSALATEISQFTEKRFVRAMFTFRASGSTATTCNCVRLAISYARRLSSQPSTRQYP